MQAGRGGLRTKLPKQYSLQTQGLGPCRASSETLGQVTSSLRGFVSLSVKWVNNTNMYKLGFESLMLSLIQHDNYYPLMSISL